MPNSLANPAPHPTLRAVPMAVFPTLGSLQQALDYAQSKVPVTTENEMVTLLMTYHNTLLEQLQREQALKALR